MKQNTFHFQNSIIILSFSCLKRLPAACISGPAITPTSARAIMHPTKISSHVNRINERIRRTFLQEQAVKIFIDKNELKNINPFSK